MVGLPDSTNNNIGYPVQQQNLSIYWKGLNIGHLGHPNKVNTCFKTKSWNTMACSIYRMPGTPMTHGPASGQAPSITELVWFIKSTCNPMCSVRVPHLGIPMSIPRGLRWMWKGVNIVVTILEPCSLTAISLFCPVLSSSCSILPALLCSSPNPNFHSSPMKCGWATSLVSFSSSVSSALPRYSSQQR